MNTLLPFAYGDQPVRVASIDGEPWFVLADLCKALGISNARMVADRLADDMKGVSQIDTPGGRQSATIVSEPGMYEVVIRSDKPEAAAFRRWITTEVLPSIRKRGMYATASTVEAMLADPDTAIRLLSELKEERAQRAELEARAEADRPKVIFADAVAASQTDILVGDLAKILRGNGVQIGANRLFAWLRDNGFLIRREGTDYNSPTQRSMEMGLFRIKETAITHSDGHVTVSKTPKVTGRGQAYFVERFLREHDGEAA